MATERRGNSAGRREQDRIVQLVTNPFAAEIVLATQRVHTLALQGPPLGFGFFTINTRMRYHWEMHGLALHHPELAIGIMSTINVELATQEGRSSK